VLGIDHPDTQMSRKMLAEFYVVQQRYKEAEPLAQELVELTPKDNREYRRRKKLLDDIREKLKKQSTGEHGRSDG
jgi:hypothetical protein